MIKFKDIFQLNELNLLMNGGEPDFQVDYERKPRILGPARLKISPTMLEDLK